MASIHPFRALRPAPAAAPAVSSVPYDVVSTDEARQLATGNPLSFLHVTRSEIDLPDGTDPYAAEVYARAKASDVDVTVSATVGADQRQLAGEALQDCDLIYSFRSAAPVLRARLAALGACGLLAGCGDAGPSAGGVWGDGEVRKFKLSGRGAYYCPACQEG